MCGRAQHSRVQRRPGGGVRAATRGFTLIELMMAMVISGIVLLGLFAFSSIQRSTAELHYRDVRMQQALEGAMWSIGRDVRMAGLGVTRMCTELRVWSAVDNKLVNPGAYADLAQVETDPLTREPYWVLRDGLQAHWRSSQTNNAAVNLSNITGGALSSAAHTSPADSFDVLLGERNYTSGSGTMALNATLPATSSTSAVIEARFETGSILNSADALDLAAVRQLFPPGSFVVIARTTTGVTEPFRPETRGQCVLLQVTGEVLAGVDSNQWRIPISSVSGFNANLAALAGSGGGMTPLDATGSAVQGDDWNPGATGGDAAVGSVVIAVGRLRWSRYEIDYSIPNRPYLVRTDFISWRNGDPSVPVTSNFPACVQTPGQCRLAQLHLPLTAADLTMPRTAIAPMIEDMQVSVGCDGYRANSTPVTNNLVAPPDTGFAEPTNAGAGMPNLIVDELTGTDRRIDEWLGNSASEQSAPDCVYYGTGEKRKTQWAASAIGYENVAGPGFRMSPQTLRVTLVAKPEQEAPAGYDEVNAAVDVLYPIEDRPQMPTNLPRREYRAYTQTFSPKNLRWRDPGL